MKVEKSHLLFNFGNLNQCKMNFRKWQVKIYNMRKRMVLKTLKPHSLELNFNHTHQIHVFIHLYVDLYKSVSKASSKSI